jgi:hypothetical protein
LSSLSRNSSTSHRRLTAILVRLDGGEEMANGEGAGGGMDYGSSVTDGGSAWTPAAVVIEVEPHPRWCGDGACRKIASGDGWQWRKTGSHSISDNAAHMEATLEKGRFREKLVPSGLCSVLHLLLRRRRGGWGWCDPHLAYSVCR